MNDIADYVYGEDSELQKKPVTVVAFTEHTYRDKAPTGRRLVIECLIGAVFGSVTAVIAVVIVCALLRWIRS